MLQQALINILIHIVIVVRFFIGYSVRLHGYLLWMWTWILSASTRQLSTVCHFQFSRRMVLLCGRIFLFTFMIMFLCSKHIWSLSDWVSEPHWCGVYGALRFFPTTNLMSQQMTTSLVNFQKWTCMHRTHTRARRVRECFCVHRIFITFRSRCREWWCYMICVSCHCMSKSHVCGW